MIESNNLRPGNLVKDNRVHCARYVEVLDICTSINRKNEIYVSNDNNFFWLKNTDVDGIKLSDELMDACAKRDTGSIFGGWLIPLGDDCGEFMRIVNDSIIGWNFPFFGNTPVKIEFVHDLQNLVYALTKTTLSIKLPL